MSKLAAILMLVGMPQLSLSDSATVDFYVADHMHVHSHSHNEEPQAYDSKIMQADLSGDILMTLESNMKTLQM